MAPLLIIWAQNCNFYNADLAYVPTNCSVTKKQARTADTPGEIGGSFARLEMRHCRHKASNVSVVESRSQLEVFLSDIINFYLRNEPYGEFSNFAPYRIHLDGKTWPTSEHYFQAMKFLDEANQTAVGHAKTPKIAAEMGRDRKRPLREDWESVKNEIMKNAVRAKFTQHEDLKKLLIETGDATLVEHTKNDSYWGDGGDGSGKNMLGIILMQVRDELRAADPK
jgi:N-glycosidase YbiA